MARATGLQAIVGGSGVYLMTEMMMMTTTEAEMIALQGRYKHQRTPFLNLNNPRICHHKMQP